MDERSIEWRWLLPSDSRFTIHGRPPGLAGLLADRLGPNPNAFLGWRLGSQQLPPADAYQSMVLINPRGISRNHLRAMGFERTLSLCALPSLADPRVFAPLANRLAAARALDFITVYRPVAWL